MSNGIGCTCHAYSESECSCDADWTPQEVYDLRRQLVDEKLHHQETKKRLHEVPLNWQLVPKKPTSAMIEAACKLPRVFSVGDEWEVMLSAAPNPPDLFGNS